MSSYHRKAATKYMSVAGSIASLEERSVLVRVDYWLWACILHRLVRSRVCRTSLVFPSIAVLVRSLNHALLKLWRRLWELLRMAESACLYYSFHLHQTHLQLRPARHHLLEGDTDAFNHRQ